MRSKLFNAWKALGLVPSPWALDIHRFIRSVPWAVIDCWLRSSSNSCIINELFTWLHFIFPIERFWRQGPWHLFFPCLKHLPLDCLEWNLVVKQSSANFFSKEPGSEHSRLMGYRSFSQLLNSAESPSPMSDSLWLSDCIVHGILQARRMEWVAFPFSRGSSQPRGQTQVSALQADSLPDEPQRKPKFKRLLLIMIPNNRCIPGPSQSNRHTLSSSWLYIPIKYTTSLYPQHNVG